MSAARDHRAWASDGALVLAGGAAILLQLLDPTVATAVARHSRFARDPVGRLTGTLRYVYAVSIGTDAAADAAASRVGRAHRAVPGADDPDSQLWVAATLYWAGTRAHELLRGPMRAPLADEVYARSARLGSSLGMPAESWPADRIAFAEWWRGRIAAASAGPDARRVAHDLMRPGAAPGWLRAAMPLARLLTAGMLPPEVRRAYDQPWTPALERRFRRTLRVIRLLWRFVPRALRELPARRLSV